MRALLSILALAITALAPEGASAQCPGGVCLPQCVPQPTVQHWQPMTAVWQPVPVQHVPQFQAAPCHFQMAPYYYRPAFVAPAPVVYYLVPCPGGYCR